MTLRIVCIADQEAGARHSSIDGIFGVELPAFCDVTLVYFTKDGSPARREGNRIILPYRLKHGNLCQELNRFAPLRDVDLVLVRNFFPVLSNVLSARRRHSFKVGFWNSFPHSYRTLFQAEQEKRGVALKRLRYGMVSYLERRLVRQCDFLIAMSPEFKESFYDGVEVPFFPLPMGVTFHGLPRARQDRSGPLKMIYTGTVDRLRRTDEVAAAIAGVPGDFALDIFTASETDVVRAINGLGDRRITIRGPLPRHELFREMADYDLGIGLIPENRLYNVSSPTKTIEYYGVGIPALVNYLPEYTRLFDRDTAFFCDFTSAAIASAVRGMVGMDREELRRMGEAGRCRILAQRDYRVLARNLYDFLAAI